MPSKQKWEAIKAALLDYAVLLKDRGDTSGELKLGQRMARKTPGATGLSSYSMLKSSRSEEEWYRLKLIEWREAKRLTGPPDFLLRVSTDPLPPYTLARVRAAMPWLKTLDALAALIELDGVVQGDFMDAHRNIRLVIEEIVETALERKLAEKLEAIFGRVLEEVRADAPIPKDEISTNNVGARKSNKCSKCGVPGHRATTCIATGPVELPKFRCGHCSAITPGNPITHAVPPAQFHQGDPSYRPERDEVAA